MKKCSREGCGGDTYSTSWYCRYHQSEANRSAYQQKKSGKAQIDRLTTEAAKAYQRGLISAELWRQITLEALKLENENV